MHCTAIIAVSAESPVAFNTAMVKWLLLLSGPEGPGPALGRFEGDMLLSVADFSEVPEERTRVRLRLRSKNVSPGWQRDEPCPCGVQVTGNNMVTAQ